MGGFVRPDGKMAPFSVEAYEQMGRHLVEAWFDTVRVGLRSPEFNSYVFGDAQISLPYGHGFTKTSPEVAAVFKSISRALAEGEQ